MKAPVIMWILRDSISDEIIIIDTGASDSGWAEQYHHGLVQSPDQVPRRALEIYGVDPAKVGIVVNSHLHWDHSWNNALFPNATVLVQRKEMGYALAPYDVHRVYYEVTGTRAPPWLSSFAQMHPIDGDYHLRPGVDLIHLPGHTPGSQGVLVQGVHATYLIAGDCIGLREKWDGLAGMRHIPSGIHIDLTEYYATFAKMDQIVTSTGARVLPGHDMSVLEEAAYE